MAKKEIKTNAMRILDRMKIPYKFQAYECDEFTDGIETADKLNLPHEQVYKTIVTTGKSGQHYVFVLPIEKEIDLKDQMLILEVFLLSFRSPSLGILLLHFRVVPPPLHYFLLVI